MCESFISMAKRLCEGRDCKECPVESAINGSKSTCAVAKVLQCNNAARQFEVVEKWAKENPMPRYPTWNEWTRVNGFNSGLCKHDFMEADCYMGNCSACKNTPIPEEIAIKLGIPPIGDKAKETEEKE